MGLSPGILGQQAKLVPSDFAPGQQRMMGMQSGERRVHA